MTSISTAIGTERRARVFGYKITRGVFNNDSGNLPQIIAVLGEANEANQATLSTEKREITSAQEAGEVYGFGSPIHQQMRILRPNGSNGVGGIPTIVFPQASDPAATATEHTWQVAGTATSNATHFMVVAGRRGIDFQNYDFSVVIGDTPAIIAQKMADAVNGVLGSPVTATANADEVLFRTKWAGESSMYLNTSIDVRGNNGGLTYSQTTVVDGGGAVDLSDSLDQFGNTWITIVLNPYGANENVLSALEQFNGLPNDIDPTGRYVGRVFMPFVSLFGSTEDDRVALSDITNDDDRVAQVTNALCPAPRSQGFPAEAAANMCRLFAVVAQNTPELDVNSLRYPDMPTPEDGNIGDMSDYNNRDFLVRNGCSTVILENGAYQVQDFVTTYHPEGEIPLQFNYPRNLMIDWNIRDGYRILERNNVLDRVILRNGQVTSSSNSITPDLWRSILFTYFEDLEVAALIRDSSFSKESLDVQISGENPNRFETCFSYRRTGIARIASTDVKAGF